MKIAMISQPIKELPKAFVDQARANATAELEANGYIVIDQRERTEEEKAEDMKVYFDFDSDSERYALHSLARSIKVMSKCDAVYFCRGWKNTRGCRIEHAIATAYNIQTFYEQD